MRYLIKVDLEYEIEADSKDEAIEILGDRLEQENTNANNEFWGNAEVIGEDEVKFNI